MDAIVKAWEEWEDLKSNPYYHQQQKNKLREEWPEMFKAVQDAVLKEKTKKGIKPVIVTKI